MSLPVNRTCQQSPSAETNLIIFTNILPKCFKLLVFRKTMAPTISILVV